MSENAQRMSLIVNSGYFLGVEGGGTRTVALLARDGHLVRRAELGPGNLRLLEDAALRRLLDRLAQSYAVLGRQQCPVGRLEAWEQGGQPAHQGLGEAPASLRQRPGHQADGPRII